MAPLVTVHPTGTAWFLRQLADVGPWSWARLVVLAVEVGGPWSAETSSFLAQLAKAKSRQPLLQKRAEQAWRLRWTGILGCALQRKPLHCSSSRLHMARTGMSPSCSEVLAEHQYDGLAP